MELLTPLDTICRLILRAKEMEAQVPSTASDDDPENAEWASRPLDAIAEGVGGGAVERGPQHAAGRIEREKPPPAHIGGTG